MLARALPGFCVMLTFAFSLWSSLWQPSGVAMIAWIFGWPALCAAAMLLVWLHWSLRYSQTAWQSTYVFMFAVIYLVAAELGALAGNLLSRRRAAEHAPVRE